MGSQEWIYQGCRESPLAKDLPRLIYHRRTLSKDLLLRAVTGTSFFPIRAHESGDQATLSTRNGRTGAAGCGQS